MITKSKLRDNLKDKREDRLLDGVKIWTSFYRSNPHRFCQDYFGLKLFPYQIIMLYLMQHNLNSTFITSRGLGKSFTIALYLCYRAVLFPSQKIIISTETLDQSSQLIKEKIETELCGMSPNLKREILYIREGKKGIVVKFRNNSTIEAINASENTRGRRCHILVS